MTGIGRADETPQINVGRPQITQQPTTDNEKILNSTFGEGFKTEDNSTMGWTPSQQTEENLADTEHHEDNIGELDGGQLPEVVKEKGKDNRFKKIVKDSAKSLIPGIGPFIGTYNLFKKSFNDGYHSEKELDKNGKPTGNRIVRTNILDEKGNKTGFYRVRIEDKKKNELSHQDFNKQDQLVSQVIYDEKGFTKTDFEYEGDDLIQRTESRFENGDIKSKITYNADNSPISIAVTDDRNYIVITNGVVELNGQAISPDSETNIVKLPYNEDLANQSDILFDLLELEGFDANEEENYIELEFATPEL